MLTQSRYPLMLAALLSISFASNLQAEQMFSDEHYEIHYNAFNSTLIPAEVASRYDITRSGSRGLINVAVLEKQPDGSTSPVSAQVTGEVRNLIQQIQPVDFREITETDAIYSIGSFQFTNEDQLTFKLEVQPDPDRSAYQIEFQQTFYVD